MYISILTYTKSLPEVDKYLKEHVDFLNLHFASGRFICAGPQNPREGGIILCNAKSKDEVWEIMKTDPFYQNQVADYQIIEFNPTKYSMGFEKFFN